MKRNFAVILTLLLLNFISYSQDKTEFFPDDLLIQPFTANILEPKLGFLFQLDANELRLDIGNSLDLIRHKLNENETISFGADLFTYTLLRSESDFHFPVDAVDYLFGVNFGYLKKLENSEYGLRLRISHISAHFVDGHFDNQRGEWRGGLNPRVYSREFFELMPFYKFNNLRLYVGVTYLFNVTPDELGKDSYQAGFDYFMTEIFDSDITPFLAYDFKLVNIEEYSGNNSINAGVKLGKPNGKGLSFYFHYYSGKSVHGEYYDFNRTYSAIGFNLDL